MWTRLVLVDIRSDAGSNCLGQALSPVEMRKAGLEQKLRDLGYVVVNCCGINEMRCQGGDINRDRGVRAEWSCYAALCALEDMVKGLEFHDTKIFLGGDCSVLPGIMSGMNKIPALKDLISKGWRMGVIYFAGDNNLKLPPKPDEPVTALSGVLDLMNVSTLTQREGSLELATSFNTHQGDSHIYNKNIVLFGTIDHPAAEEEAYIRDSGLRHTPRSTVALNPKALATRELEWLEDNTEMILVHFNVDVIESETFPLANYPIPGGLSFEQAMEALGVFLTCEKLCAVFITGINPLNDPDGTMVQKLVDGIVEAMRIRLRSITDGEMG